MIRRKTYRNRCSKKRKTFGRGKKLPYTRNGRIYLGSSFPIGALISVATSLLSPALVKKYFEKMRRKHNFVMMKKAKPKRVTLPDSRTFVARYGRVPRSRVPPHITKRRRYKGAPARQSGRGIASAIKRLLQFRKKAAKKIITSSAAKKHLAKNLANKALDKAPGMNNSLSNRNNNKTIKKTIKC